MDVEADLLRLQVIAGPEPWSGTYIREKGDDGCTMYLQEQLANNHVIVWRKQGWCIARDSNAPVLARQKDEAGPLTDRGQQPWKIMQEDGCFHRVDPPIQVLPIPKEADWLCQTCQAPAERSSGASATDASISSSALPGDWLCSKCQLSADAMTTASTTNAIDTLSAAPNRSSSADTAAALEQRHQQGAGSRSLPNQEDDLEVLDEKGLQEPVAELAPGAAVYRHVRICRGVAEGWQVQGRLEMDRHSGKQSSRAPRWKYIHPDGKTCFSTLKAQSYHSSAVERHVSPDIFQKLTAAQDSIKVDLSRRKRELNVAGCLINEELEDQWQSMLSQRVFMGNNRCAQELRQRYTSSIDRAPTAPEWQLPARLDTEYRAAPTPTRKRELDGQMTERPMHELAGVLRRRDPFLRYMLRSVAPPIVRDEEEMRYEIDEFDRHLDVQPDSEASVGRSHLKRRRQEEFAADDADAELADSSAHHAETQRTAVPLGRLLSGRAAAEAELETHSDRPWLRLICGELLEEAQNLEEHRHALKDMLQAAPQEEAEVWRCFLAICMLGKAGSDLPFICADLLAVSQAIPNGRMCGLLARMFAVRDAILVAKDGDGSSKVDIDALSRTILRYFICSLPGGETAQLVDLQSFVCGYMREKETRARAVSDALRKDVGSDLLQLCAFSLEFFKSGKFGDTSSVAQMSFLLDGVCELSRRRRAVAILIGAFLTLDKTAWQTLTMILFKADWTMKAGDLLQWELWLTLMPITRKGAKDLASKSVPAPAFLNNAAGWMNSGSDLQLALDVWQEFLKNIAAIKGVQEIIVGIIVSAKSIPVPHAVAIELLQLSVDVVTHGRLLARCMEIWQQEVHVISKHSMKLSTEEGAAIAAECASRLQICMDVHKSWSRQLSGPSPTAAASSPILSWMCKAAEATAANVALLLQLGVQCHIETAEKIVAQHYACPLVLRQMDVHEAWFSVPNESVGPSFRGEEDQHGPSFNVAKGLSHWNGQSFATVLEGCRDDLISSRGYHDPKGPFKFVNWAIDKHLESTSPFVNHTEFNNKALVPQSGSSSVNHEVNRFAHWILDEVFDYCPELLLVPMPGSAVSSKSSAQVLDCTAAKFQAVCQGFFGCLLHQLGDTGAHSAKFIRQCAMVVCLQASCICCVISEDARDSLNAVLLELLSSLQDSGHKPSRAGFVAYTDLQGAVALPDRMRKWAFSMLARNIQKLLLWLDRLDSNVCEVRAGKLFRFAAAAARHLRGQWPGSHSCPRSLPVASKLVFDPLKNSKPPGAQTYMAASPGIMRLRPLAAVLAYSQPRAGAALGSFYELEQHVGASPSAEHAKRLLGAWAAALAGSDTEDLVCLSPWRLRTYECLSQRGDLKTLRRLQAAVSSRCATLHCGVELSRTIGAVQEKKSLQTLVMMLLCDLAEPTLAALLMEHHEASNKLLDQNEDDIQQDIALPALRHLLYRYVALVRLVKGMGENWSAELTLEARQVLARLHVWFERAGMAGESTEVVQSMARGFAQIAGSLRLPMQRDVGSSQLRAEEIAPAPESEDGCFRGGDFMPEGANGSLGEVACAMLDTAEGSPFGVLVELSQVQGHGET